MILSTVGLLIFSCKKDSEDIEKKEEVENTENIDPYQLPWKTEFIHYTNVDMCSGSHSSGYKLYYKDSLLQEECVQSEGITISESLTLNDSILHLFFIGVGSYDLMTRNGGYSWEHFSTGPPEFYKKHVVNNDLIYCVTKNQNDLYFTGVGESNLSVYEDTLTAGTHHLIDSGARVSGIDSTVIILNDSISFVIKFQ